MYLYLKILYFPIAPTFPSKLLAARPKPKFEPDSINKSTTTISSQNVLTFPYHANHYQQQHSPLKSISVYAKYTINARHSKR